MSKKIAIDWFRQDLRLGGIPLLLTLAKLRNYHNIYPR